MSQPQTIFKSLCFTTLVCCALTAQSQNKKVVPFTITNDLYYLFLQQESKDTVILSLNDTILFNPRVQAVTMNIGEHSFRVIFRRLCAQLTPSVTASDSLINVLYREVTDLGRTFKSNHSRQEHWGIPDNIYARIERNENLIIAAEDTITQIRKLKKIIEYRYQQFQNSVSDSLRLLISGARAPDRLKDLEQFRFEKTEFQKKYQHFIDTLSDESLKKKLKEVVKNRSVLDSLDAKKKVLKLSKRGFGREIKELKSKHSICDISVSGNALTVFNEGNNDTRQTTTGIGINVDKADIYEFNFQLTLSQSQDTIAGKADEIRPFGSSLLVPGIRRYSILTNFRQFSLFPFSQWRVLRKFGLGLSVNITPMIWKKDSAGVDSSPLSANVIPATADVFISFNWLNSVSHNRKVARTIRISTDIGMANRFIFGDLGQNEKACDFFLGARQRAYSGLYLGINVRLDDLTIYFNGPMLFGPGVPGLTRGQTIANIGIRGNLFKLQ